VGVDEVVEYLPSNPQCCIKIKACNFFFF
jgi:hypothetical protein